MHTVQILPPCHREPSTAANLVSLGGSRPCLTAILCGEVHIIDAAIKSGATEIAELLILVRPVFETLKPYTKHHIS